MMRSILILTKNVLAEEEIQRKLQHLNYEVYCSSRLLSRNSNQGELRQVLKLFFYTIISETISDIEVENILPILKRSSTIIIRKNDHLLKSELVENDLSLSISNQSSIEELRETLMKPILSEMDSKKSNKKDGVDFYQSYDEILPKSSAYYSLSKLSLSGMERKILFKLYLAKGKIVSRDELVEEIWSNGINDSNLAMLSNGIRRLKLKLSKEGLSENVIKTLWGKGYRLEHEFFEFFGDELSEHESFYFDAAQGM